MSELLKQESIILEREQTGWGMYNSPECFLSGKHECAEGNNEVSGQEQS